MGVPILRPGMQYVVRLSKPGNGRMAYLGHEPGSTVEVPKEARKFTLPADAHCHVESHAMSFEGWFFEVCAFDPIDGRVTVIA